MRRVALVTGGGTGIGRGIALALAGRGVDVALAGRRAGSLASVAAEVAALGVRAVALEVDLADPQARADLPARVNGELGPVSILVNNAAVMYAGVFGSRTVSEARRAVAVNLLAPIELTLSFLPDLARLHGGVILLSSTAGRVPLPYTALYAATKAGLIALGESLRYELAAEGVRLLVAYPPATATAMSASMAQASGFPALLLANPNRVGEKIVRSFWSGKREMVLGSDRSLLLLYRLAPSLVRAVFRSQLPAFRRMMESQHVDEGNK